MRKVLPAVADEIGVFMVLVTAPVELV
jgi:hypothetical protein